MTGPINAATDPDTGLRMYTWQQQVVPSVTSIRRLIGMPFNLHHWTVSKVIDRAISQHQMIDAMLNRERRKYERNREANIIREVSKHLRAAATDERDIAGEKGTAIHDAIALGLQPGQVDQAIFGYVAQYHDWLQTMNARILWQERQVWNLTYGYAGTADALVLLPDGRIICVDWKSSRGVYLDHAIQLIAYGMGEFVGENDVIDQQATDYLTQASGLAILHLSENEWEWLEVRADPVIFQAFLGSLSFAKFLYAMQNSIDPVIVSKRKGGTLVPALAAGLKLIEGQRSQPNGTGN